MFIITLYCGFTILLINMLLNIILIVLFSLVLREIPNKIQMFIYNYWTVHTFARVVFFKWNFKLVPTYSKEIPLKWCVIYHRTPQNLFQRRPQNVQWQKLHQALNDK